MTETIKLMKDETMSELEPEVIYQAEAVHERLTEDPIIVRSPMIQELNELMHDKVNETCGPTWVVKITSTGGYIEKTEWGPFGLESETSIFPVTVTQTNQRMNADA